MKNWREYLYHTKKSSKNEKIDGNIYTFDIETTSYLILNGKQLETEKYLSLTEEEQKECKFQGLMYIWTFGINDTIYYGRTWKEFRKFLERLEKNIENKKIVFVHNLSFEFQFLRNEFNFKDVFARKPHKVMKAILEDFNIEFKCTLFLTNAKLEDLPKIYGLKTQKLIGDLDYSKIRTNTTKLTKKELKYCENDCLILYEYIKKELEIYKKLKKIPLTNTGKVRKELKEKISKNYSYKNKVISSINIDGHIYNMLIEAFAGGYTHSNWIYTDEIIENIYSYDFTSSYPYVMLTEKFPMSEFKKCIITSDKQMINSFAYILKVKFKNLKCKFYNNFISQNKCLKIKNGKYDNGRIISADEIEIILTDVDFKFILESYKCKYEILESYYSIKKYLPIDFINFIFEKYEIKTKYKGIENKKIEYNIEKRKI